MATCIIQSQVLTPRWNWGGEIAYLRIFASAPFYDTDGNYIANGSVTNPNSFFAQYECTVAGTIVTIPQVTIATTTDSSVPTVVYTATLFDYTGTPRYTLLSQFFVDPFNIESSVPPNVLVQLAGSTLSNGTYTYRGQANGKYYYNLAGQATSTTLYVLIWTGSQWKLTSNIGTSLYTSSDDELYPYNAVWSQNLGLAPVPNFSPVISVVATNWEDLTASNQGSIPFAQPLNAYWTIPQVKEYVLRNQSPINFASVGAAGKVFLDTNPINPQIPIAVASNSNRISRVLSEDYGNDLATAIDEIGSIPTVLIIKDNTTITTDLATDANTVLEFQQGAMVINDGGTLEINGEILNTNTLVPYFSGFAAGEVALANSPAQVSSEIVDTGTDSISDRVEIVDAMFASKAYQLICYPRPITKSVNILNFSHISFMAGEFTNIRNDNVGLAAFGIASNTTVTGVPGQTVIFESTHNNMGAIFSPPDADDTIAVENIYYSGLTFKGSSGQNLLGFANTIGTGACSNGGIYNCIFDETHYYNSLGGVANSGNHGFNLAIENCVFINPKGGQPVAIPNCDVARIIGNTFYVESLSVTGDMIDSEPNTDDDRVSDLAIMNNTFAILGPNDFSFAGSPILVQAGPTPSINRVIIANNTMYGAALGAASLSPMTVGAQCIGVQDLQVYDNHVQSAYQQGAFSFTLCRNISLHDNTAIQCGSVGADIPGLAWMQGVAFSDVYNNIANEVVGVMPQKTNIIEREIDFVVTVNGATITRTGINSYRFYDLFEELSVVINNATYTVDTYISQNEITTTTSIGTYTPLAFTAADVTIGTGNIHIPGHGYITGGKVNPTTAGTLPVNAGLVAGTPVYIIRVDNNNLKLATTYENAINNVPMTYSGAGSGTSTITPVMTTLFSSNTYQGNKADDGIVLEPNGASLILGDYRREIKDWLPISITSNQDNYAPSRNAYRLDFTTDASRNLTGLVFTQPPQLNGEKHWIRNTGSFNLVLSHQSGSSSAANRFFCNTGANITLTPNDSAHIEYDTNGFWFVYKDLSTIAVGDLPTGIPATSIGNGDVNNAELSYVNGVTSAIQTQLDAKAPLVSPSLTTPSLGVAAGTSLNLSGALVVGAGTSLTKLLRGSVTIDPASVAANTIATQTFTLTGAVAGDSLILNIPTAGLTAGLLVEMFWVSAANQISVTFNNTTGGAIDESSATWFYTVIRS